ncbi:MAG: HypC/HybG/HupF family hydrogenase formation chaperone [Verrucomicrobiota bacterium]|nr:HypC/HybG/HupF family hydrogenase formation chaperone [Verrucomicrobiota bacterium]
MCLAIPGKVIEIHREHDLLMGKAQFGGIAKRVCLEYVPEAKIGDYVLVHVGFALALIDEEEAKRVFELLQEMGGLEELAEPPAAFAPGTDPPPQPDSVDRQNSAAA